MIKRQSLIALGVALVLGLIAVYLANVFLTNTEQRAKVAEVGMTKVAVAAVPLDYGVEVTPEKVRLVDFPANSIPPGSYPTLAQLLPGGKKRVALRPIQVNEPILASKLTGEGQNASLAAVLPDGMRAAAVRINDVSGVAGFVQPNDSVDVLITRAMASDQRGQQVTDVLLQNVRVIAIDQNAKDANGQPVLARTATLEVAPVDAQKLALAQQVGQLSLVIRKPGIEQGSGVQTVSLNDLRYSYYGGARVTPAVINNAATRISRITQPVRRPAPAVRIARPNTNNVEVVRGTQGSNYEVGGYGS